MDLHLARGLDRGTVVRAAGDRITSYNVCYTKLLRDFVARADLAVDGKYRADTHVDVDVG